MGRPCVFCPKDATTYEHVIPAWLPRHLGLSGVILDRRKGKIGETRKIDGPFGAIRAKILCDDCQRHFARLEAEVKPLLLPMIDGQPTPAYLYWQQRYIALWATKTAYALLAREGWPLPREEERHWLRETQEPSPWTLVLAVPYGGTELRFIHEPRQWPDIPSEKPDEPVETYSVVMVFGRVAFRVFGFLKAPPSFAMGEPRYEDESGRIVPLAVRFWPPPSLEWPGEVPMIGDDAVDLLAAWTPFTTSPVATEPPGTRDARPEAS